ncbi:hypothetical protein D9758_007176 [Tetrapyrgos nigripes]|uniref:Phosphoribosyltransferase domain-containing protein n=1 Tax=Tetrapyrgos nigripes TaxID=182062 RepID=A0A8H5D0S1_9AGAR|nr:hypothetical protein D9758_007176 [Tetrapyrgos nigripes]
MANQVGHLHVTYNNIHNLIKECTPKIGDEFNPDLMVAIGGGGFFPARVMRTFLRGVTKNKTLQIQAIGLSLYEPVEGGNEDQIGQEVIRTQWLGPNAGKLLLGKRVLIVDEVDDTRKTLHYALSELKKDVEAELSTRPESEREALRAATKFGIFVVHNKKKPKLAELPRDIPYVITIFIARSNGKTGNDRYYAGEDVDDVWLDYPWESTNIEEHDRLAMLDRSRKSGQ